METATTAETVGHQEIIEEINHILRNARWSGIFFYFCAMSDWNQKIADSLRQELQGINEKDIRFFRVEEYLRMVERVDRFSGECHECHQFLPEIEKQVGSIHQALKTIGKDRRRYDKHLSQLGSHMKKAHGFYPPYYFTYTYSFFFALAAIAFGFLVSFLFPSVSIWFFVVPGFILGLLVAQLYGGSKDAKIRANKKLL